MSNPQEESKAMNDSDETPLMEAVERDEYEEVVSLLKTPQDLEYEAFGETALTKASDLCIVLALLSAGADIRRISHEGRRALVGLPPFPSDTALSTVPKEQFLSGRTRRFGNKNPDRLNVPFWDAMVRLGLSAWDAGEYFEKDKGLEWGEPIWCAKRYGQSITRLPDGRVIQIAGEHEDSYDPDFCIYNDVFVHYPVASAPKPVAAAVPPPALKQKSSAAVVGSASPNLPSPAATATPNGGFVVYSYPEDVFPPTDFHSATLMGGYIYVIGSLGYQGDRHYGYTPVYRLDTTTFAIEKVELTGEAPGWIHRHDAVAVSEHEICVSGGTIIISTSDGAESTKNEAEYVLDTVQATWKRKDVGGH